MKLFNRKFFWYALYYGVAYHLPETRGCGAIGRWSGALRYLCVRHIIKRCGHHVNIHRHAFFGSGKDIELGDYSDMGLDCHLPNDISDLNTPMNQQGRVLMPGHTVIGSDVWIGREVMIVGGVNVLATIA